MYSPHSGMVCRCLEIYSLKGLSCLSIADVSLRVPPWQSPLEGRGGLPCWSAQGVCCPSAGTQGGGYSQCLTARSEMGLGHAPACPSGHWGAKGRWCCHSVLSVTCDQRAFVLIGVQKVPGEPLQCDEPTALENQSDVRAW